MRQFLVLGHDAPTDPGFSLDGLPGAGRVDLLARCVTASLLRSHGIRENVRTHLVLGDAYTVTFDGATLRGLHPDERSTAAHIREALEHREAAIGAMPADVSPGIRLSRRGFEATVETLDGTVVALHESGDPAAERPVPSDPVFVLSDHGAFEADEREVLERIVDRWTCLGPEAIHADHAIAVTHNWLDTDGYRSY